MEDYHQDALLQNKSTFANYLETMPGAGYLNPQKNCSLNSCSELKVTDTAGCGRAREYFGFPESFVNDKQICIDILQFRNTRDFDFIDEFFNLGTPEGPTNGDTARLLVPPLILPLPDAGKLCVRVRNLRRNMRGIDCLLCVSLTFSFPN